MAFETRELEGSLFRNDRKDKPNQPDYTGRVRIGGTLYRLAGWKKARANGDGYLSLQVRAEAEQAPRASPAPETAASPEFDDEIPF